MTRSSAWLRPVIVGFRLTIGLAIGLAACDRGDTAPAATARPAAIPRAAPMGPAPGSADHPGCLVPMPASPPPEPPPAAECPEDPEPASSMPMGRVSFPDAPGTPAVDVEIARTARHRQRGLMYRTALPEDRGMLFSWRDEAVRSFWMRNTCIPLDMLFIAMDGTLLGVVENVPTLNDAPRSVPCPAAHVLEVNAGWSRAHGVEPGQKVRIEI